MANILKQIKVGNTTYNIEPVTSYLPLSGGTMTGPIYYQGTKAKYGMIKWIDNTGDTYGNGIRIGGGGATIIGGGESADLPSLSGGDEVLYLMNDGNIDFYSNCQEGLSSAKHMTFDVYGTLNVPTDVKVNGNSVIHSGNIGSQSVKYASNAGWAKASDVYDWAKASTKPSYTKAEVGLGNVDNTADANKNVNYATSSHFLRTYNSGDGSHGWDFLLKCKHNVDGDGRFKLQIIRTADGSVTHSTSVDYATSAGNADRLDGKHSSDFCLSSSNITNLPINGGIYWNSYVESNTDGSDAASITVIKDGNGTNGTVLQIKQANDANDIVNVVAGDLKLNGTSVSTYGHDHDDRYYTESEINTKLNSKSDTGHTHTSLKSNTDNRNTNTTPNDYNGVLNIAGLKDNSKIGLDTNIYGTYSCLIGVRGWQDSSGGDSHEIALTGNGQIMHRNGSTTSWGSWDKIAHTSYIDTYFPRAKVGNDSPYSNVYTSFIGGVSDGPRGTGWEFLYRAEHRNGSGDGPNYIMEIVSNLTSDSSIYWRKKTGGSFTSFREIIDSNNIGSQSVNFANGAEIANYANSAGSANSVAWGNITDKPSTFPPSGHTHTDVVRFDHDKYAFGDNGSWRLQEYDSTGNSLDIRYGKININAQEKTYSVSFAGNKSLTNTNYAIVFGIYRSDRNSWFWSPLVKTRDKTGFTVYVRGNTSGDNSGTLFYIAIRSN